MEQSTRDGRFAPSSSFGASEAGVRLPDADSLVLAVRSLLTLGETDLAAGIVSEAQGMVTHEAARVRAEAASGRLRSAADDVPVGLVADWAELYGLPCDAVVVAARRLGDDGRVDEAMRLLAGVANLHEPTATAATASSSMVAPDSIDIAPLTQLMQSLGRASAVYSAITEWQRT